MSIFIFSRPVHSGKTTELLNWCNKQKNITGIVMPDIDGYRKMLNVQSKEIFDIECLDSVNTTEHITTVGRFNFYTTVFEKGNMIISNSLLQNPDWLVIDEAGKLELDGKGFYQAIIKAVDHFTNKETTGNLIITVRDSLCAEIIHFFKLQACRVIHQLEELP